MPGERWDGTPWPGRSQLGNSGSRAGSFHSGSTPASSSRAQGRAGSWWCAQTPTPGGFIPSYPQQGGSPGWAQLPAQGQHRWVPPSSFPPVADGSDTAPYHPYFIFSRVFLACPTLTGEALHREQALLWPGVAGELNNSPSHIVCLYLWFISTYYAATSSSVASAAFICSGGRGAELCFGLP